LTVLFVGIEAYTACSPFMYVGGREIQHNLCHSELTVVSCKLNLAKNVLITKVYPRKDFYHYVLQYLTCTSPYDPLPTPPPTPSLIDPSVPNSYTTINLKMVIHRPPNRKLRPTPRRLHHRTNNSDLQTIQLAIRYLRVVYPGDSIS
jgi:hypothetical protein